MTLEEKIESMYVPKKVCFWCGCRMFNRHKLHEYPELRHNREILQRIKTRDHFIPKSRGGKGGLTVPACQKCNSQKGNMSPMEFRDLYRPHIPVETIRGMILEAKFAQTQGRHYWSPKKHDTGQQKDKMVYAP